MEREAIFEVLSRAQNIDTAELNLKELAQLSVGFTGADINAAVTMARLSVFEHVLQTKTVSFNIINFRTLNYNDRM